MTLDRASPRFFWKGFVEQEGLHVEPPENGSSDSGDRWGALHFSSAGSCGSDLDASYSPRKLHPGSLGRHEHFTNCTSARNSAFSSLCHDSASFSRVSTRLSSVWPRWDTTHYSPQASRYSPKAPEGQLIGACTFPTHRSSRLAHTAPPVRVLGGASAPVALPGADRYLYEPALCFLIRANSLLSPIVSETCIDRPVFLLAIIELGKRDCDVLHNRSSDHAWKAGWAQKYMSDKDSAFCSPRRCCLKYTSKLDLYELKGRSGL